MLMNALGGGARGSAAAAKRKSLNMKGYVCTGASRRCISYLNKTRIPTYHFQASLPKMPLPTLEDTISRYRYFANPMVPDKDDWAATQAATEEFLTSGASLQKELEEINDANYTSWISKHWFDMYLETRDALMINVTPQLTFKDEENPRKMEQATRAANLVVSSVRFYQTLRDEQLEPDIFHTKPEKSKTSLFESAVSLIPEKFSFYGAYLAGAYPLDMSQYKNLYRSTRLPRRVKDELKIFPEEEARHIIVQRGSDFFTVDVLDESGGAIDADVIEAQLRAILAKPHNSGSSVGVLTTMNRDEWADARATLESHPR